MIFPEFWEHPAAVGGKPVWRGVIRSPHILNAGALPYVGIYLLVDYDGEACYLGASQGNVAGRLRDHGYRFRYAEYRALPAGVVPASQIPPRYARAFAVERIFLRRHLPYLNRQILPGESAHPATAQFVAARAGVQ